MCIFPITSLLVVCVAPVEIFRGEVAVSSLGRWEATYKFAPCDSVIVEAEAIKGKDISWFELVHWNGPKVISYSDKKSIEARYWTPTLAYLTVLLKNTAVFDSKVYAVVIKRVPVSDSLLNFNYI